MGKSRTVEWLAFTAARSAKLRITLTDLEKYHLALAQKGDKAAFSALVSSHASGLYGFLLRMLGGQREEAEDLAQETFLRAYRSIGSFRGQSKFKTWLRRIATNLALNHFRKKRPLTHSLDFGDDDDRTYEIPDDEFSPERQLEGRQAQKFVESALAQLSDGLRTVFVLKELEGYTHEETARLLGVKAQAVRVRYHRAKKILAKLLSQQPEPALSGIKNGES